MKIFRNEKTGETSAEYRKAMNTPKRANILKKMYSEKLVGVEQTEEQFLKMFKNKILADKYCPKLLDCCNIYMCCVCENCEKFIQTTNEMRQMMEMKQRKKQIHRLEEKIMQINTDIYLWKPKEELEKEMNKLENILGQLIENKISSGEAFFQEYKE